MFIFSVYHRSLNQCYLQRCCLVRMTIIKRKCWWDVEIKELLYTIGWDHALVQRIWKPVQRFLKIVKIKLAYDPTPTSRQICKEVKLACLGGAYVYYGYLLIITKEWHEPRCLSVGKENAVCGHNGKSFSHKEERNPVLGEKKWI